MEDLDKKYWDLEAETMPGSDARRIQEDKLLEIIPYVYKNSPLHREVWERAKVKPGDIKSIEDFQEKAPFISKDMIVEYRDRTGDPSGGVLCVPLNKVRHTYKSSGTSGTPTNVFMSEKDSDMITNAYARHFWALGARPEQKLLLPNIIWHWGVNEVIKMGTKIDLSIFPLDVFDVPNIINYLKSFRPNFIFILVAPFVGPIRDKMKADNLDPKEVWKSVDFVIWTGEGITKAVRKRVEEEWGIKVFQMAGYSDPFNMTFECPEVAGTHSSGEDMFFVEVIDPDTGQVVSEGEKGEHVCTALDFEAMPLLRFRTDDLGYMSTEKCACGRTGTRSYWLGRKNDQVKIGSKSIFAIEIKEIVDAIPGVDHGIFQMLRYANDMDKLRLLVADKGEEKLDDLSEKLKSEIEKALDVQSEIEFIPFEEMIKEASPAKMPRVRNVIEGEQA
ncbi:MAG: phenylacetate--CoA ligase family protein [Desulfobacterales bacterium]|nr:phenylacetate--CoA ligase family protein [Desulfobacterales bacterium]